MNQALDRLNTALSDRYLIERELGEGGMATVYLADDLKHDRKVALKVLKPELAAVVGAERFLGEIRTTANLQHPNILPLFDSGEANGFLYYVMPYVEGETLRDRLEREKQLPVDEAVRIATDVAEALQSAHEQGVIHRDIKPANILLSRGRPLVADFGIALAVSAAGAGRLTETGLSLGTPYYMSPEQAAADRDPSAESDVYSLACVLYEMLVGEPPYTGGSAQAVLVKILTGDAPAPTEARASIPGYVDAAIKKALERLPADRFRSAAEFARALGDPASWSGKPSTEIGLHGPRSWNRLSAGLGAVATILGALALWGWLRPMPTSAPVSVPLRASITDFEARAALNTGVRMAISRDGSHIAVASFLDGVSRLFLRRSDQPGFQEIEGTEGAETPSFSPDGEWLAFMQRPLGAFREGQIKRVRVSGGPVLHVTDGDSPHWGRDGTIVFERPDGIYKISPPDGDAGLIAEGHQGNAWPHLLPDGRAVLYKSDEARGRTLMLANLESGTITDLGLSGANPQYVQTGHIVYGHESQSLMAVRFDLETLRVIGEPSAVLPEVLVYDGGATQFAISETGTAIYGLPGPSGLQTSELAIVDLNGSATPIRLGEGRYGTPRFSPDGRRITYERDRKIWVYDRDLGENSLLTTDGDVSSPATWSPDGRFVYFGASRDGSLGRDVFRKSADGSEPAENLISRQEDQYPLSTFGDGPQVLTVELTETRGWDLLIATEGQGGTTYTDYLRAPWNELMGTISPDGTKVAYVSNESGTQEIYVRSFPEAEGRMQVSEGGGREPRWAKDGEAVYYLNGRTLMKAPVMNGEVGAHQTLFEGSWVRATFGGSPVMTNWDVHPTDTLFVFVRNPRMEAGAGLPVLPIEVVVNWFEELKRLEVWNPMTDPIPRLNTALAGRYRIERELGEGGMATVYLADDLKHDRKVALKVLKPELAAVVGAERFLAEIKTTANLQHPNILPLFDSGEANGFLYYVMPYVEGETLRDRLEREKQLPVDEAVRIATDVAEALQSAHEQGVIHRDIKPANILLSRGRPLVADFGIALAVSAAGAGRLTETGLSLGTPYYMSPEQAAADRDPSAESDVYSLACVLYEMLVGEPPYTGGSAQAVLVKILTGDAPTPTEARPTIPPHVDAAIRKALEKLPADRFLEARDLSRALNDAGFRHGQFDADAIPTARSRTMVLAPWLVAGIAVIASIVAVNWPRTPEAPSRSWSIVLPDSVAIPFRSLSPLGIPRHAMAISPDGTSLVHIGSDGAATRLYRRDLNGFEHIPIEGTEGATYPFFSPNGEWIAYFAGTQLWRVSVRGGQPEPLAEAPNAYGGFWTEGGDIVFAPHEAMELVSVQVGAREIHPVSGPDLNAEWFFQGPRPVPGGKGILAVIRFPGTIGVIDATTGIPKQLVTGISPMYLPSGHLVFARGGTLYAVGFDPEALELVGEPVPVRAGVHQESPIAHYTVSPDGSLFFIPGPNADEGYLSWVDRSGNVDTLNVDLAEYGRTLVSPDGSRIAALTLTGGTEAIYILNPETGHRDRIIEAPGLSNPIWTPDGSAILYGRSAQGESDPTILVRRPLAGSAEDTLYRHDSNLWPSAVTEDEGVILFDSRTYGVWAVSADGSTEKVLTRAVGPWGAELSPDGNWIAYTSDVTGQYQVYVEPFPETGEQHPISAQDNSEEPLWARDGSEIYYRNGNRWWAVPVELEPEFSYGEPRLIIEGPYLNVGGRSYDLHPDGLRFLMVDVPAMESSDHIHVVTNWAAEVARTVPSGLRGRQ